MPDTKIVVKLCETDIDRIAALQAMYSQEMEQKEGVHGFVFSQESVIKTALFNEYKRVTGKGKK